MHKRYSLRLLALAGALCLCLPQAVLAQAVLAQDWPAKQPIKLVAVFPPGGSVDAVSRMLAPSLQQELGQNIIIENKGGASGSIGAAAVAAAPADGYTFAMVFDTHGVNPALIPNLPFDSKKDLSTVVVLGTAPMVLVTPANSEFKTFADVLAAAKTSKGASYGTVGSGSLGHLAMALLGKNGGLSFTHIPYKGGGPLMNDAIAGHVPLAIGSIAVVKAHLDSGRLRALAVTNSTRAPQLPNVPTVAESGFAGFEAPAWWAMLAPAKTPAAVMQRMNAAMNKVMKAPEMARRLAGQGIDVMGGTPQEGQAFIERQMDIWSKVVKENDIKPD